MALLKVEGLSRKENGIPSVDNISLSLESFQKIAVVGETGSGKTSLLKMIAGLLQPGEGSVYFEGEKVRGPDEKLMPGHPGIGYLSQYFELRNNYRVEDELDAKNTLDENDAARIFTICHIEHLLKRMTNQLSGGEKQRIALARVLISSPRLLLLDEPYSNLDMAHKQLIGRVIREIASELGITVLMVLHNPPDILSWADKVLVMRSGKLIQQGSPEEIYNYPVNEYCAALFGMYNLVEPVPAFRAVLSIPPKDKKLFFRPEAVRIAEKGPGTIGGIIKDIHHWGSYHTLDIIVENEVVRMQVINPVVKRGDIVHFIILDDSVLYI